MSIEHTTAEEREIIEEHAPVARPARLTLYPLIAQRLMDARLATGLSRAVVAEQAGIDEELYAGIERGIYSPHFAFGHPHCFHLMERDSPVALN